MKRTTILVLASVLFACLMPQAAAAVTVDPSGLWWNRVKVLSGGPYGVAANVHVNQRHPGEEYNLVIIDGQTAYDGAYTGFGWEITDASTGGPTSDFRLLLHVKWPNSSNDSFVWPSGSISTNAYHNLKIQRRSSTSSYWDCYFDGTLKTTANWSYYGSTTTHATSQLEIDPYSPTESDDYMGHIQAFQIKAANGTWYTVNSSWAVTPDQQDTQGFTRPGSLWTNPFQTQYGGFWYDWEGDMPA